MIYLRFVCILSTIIFLKLRCRRYLEKKQGTKINILLEDKLNKQLIKMNKETGISKTTIIEKALEEYFKKAIEIAF